MPHNAAGCLRMPGGRPGGGPGGGVGGVAGGVAGGGPGCRLLELNVNHLQGLQTRKMAEECEQEEDQKAEKFEDFLTQSCSPLVHFLIFWGVCVRGEAYLL